MQTRPKTKVPIAASNKLIRSAESQAAIADPRAPKMENNIKNMIVPLGR